MQVAVLSDSHDSKAMLDQAMLHLAAADAVIHCGDLISPFMVEQLAEGVGDTPVHIVWGNNDGDTFWIGKTAQKHSNVTLHGVMAEIELGGVKVAVCHYPHIALRLAQSGAYGLVCYGHSHTAHEEWIGDCLLLNPGELMGLRNPSSIALVELPGRSVERVDL
jgi:putative phosphoesterase